MTPPARVAAAIAILDQVLAGEPAEKALTNWARGSRYAGSRDRAAVRDHVFDALRRRRSLAARGGAETGRGLMLGALRAVGSDPDSVFTGAMHCPTRLSGDEIAAGRFPLAGAEALDLPDWLWPEISRDLGPAVESAMGSQQAAGPVGLRANRARIEAPGLAARLAGHGIAAEPDARSPSALVLADRPRRLTDLQEWHEGLFELQDVGSQWLADQVPLRDGESLLDYCAGGGGKTLAVAARVRGCFYAHDADRRRMQDLPVRAARAGTEVTVLPPGTPLPLCDTVLADVPCSGSGTWRRNPDAKWRLQPADLDRLTALQGRILDEAAALVRPGGHLVHATCSVLARENDAQLGAFLGRHPAFVLVSAQRLLPDPRTDGYYIAVIYKAP